MNTQQSADLAGVKKHDLRFYLPFFLSLFLVFLDQLSKILIIRHVPFRTIGASYLNGFLRIIHTRNTGIAFSIGYSWPDPVRRILFIALPVIAVIAGIVYFIKSTEITRLQQWCIAGIIGGGTGNIIDRILRPEGVVDWIDVRFYGLFGMERWPTFNVADASVVVCGLLLAGTLFVDEYRRIRKEKNEQKD